MTKEFTAGDGPTSSPAGAAFVSPDALGCNSCKALEQAIEPIQQPRRGGTG